MRSWHRRLTQFRAFPQVLSYAKLAHHPGTLMAAISKTARAKLREFTPQVLCDVAHGTSSVQLCACSETQRCDRALRPTSVSYWLH